MLKTPLPLFLVFIILVIFIVTDISIEGFLAAVACRSQDFVSRDVPQGVDRRKRAAGTVRGYELVSQFRLAGDDAIDLVVYVNFVHEVLADVVQQLMQIRVVVDIACIWHMIAIFLQH